MLHQLPLRSVVATNAVDRGWGPRALPGPAGPGGARSRPVPCPALPQAPKRPSGSTPARTPVETRPPTLARWYQLTVTAQLPHHTAATPCVTANDAHRRGAMARVAHGKQDVPENGTTFATMVSLAASPARPSLSMTPRTPPSGPFAAAASRVRAPSGSLTLAALSPNAVASPTSARAQPPTLAAPNTLARLPHADVARR